MEALAIIAGLLLLWSISRSLQHIIKILTTAKLTIDITAPTDDGGGEPHERPAKIVRGNIVSFKRRS